VVAQSLLSVSFSRMLRRIVQVLNYASSSDLRPRISTTSNENQKNTVAPGTTIRRNTTLPSTSAPSQAALRRPEDHAHARSRFDALASAVIDVYIPSLAEYLGHVFSAADSLPKDSAIASILSLQRSQSSSVTSSNNIIGSNKSFASDRLTHIDPTFDVARVEAITAIREIRNALANEQV
jgi:hypothetical protein